MASLSPEEQILRAALDLSPEQRAGFLDAACAGRPGLRRDIDKLLATQSGTGVVVDPPVAVSTSDPNVTGPHTPATEGVDPDRTGPHLPSAEGETGTIIAGKYALLRRIGEGGMGTVWMADQTEPVRRRVAVKLIKAERGTSKSIVTRFEAERQAIALMDHPNIAKLLDAGTTVRGSPYFVMELVNGVPLTDYCDQMKLSVSERLQIFLRICSAVQHAHQKGIVHRDLKPSNILVESHPDGPVPRVIDFGLAKATGGLQLTDQTLFTGFGAVLGTPLYMAPEQAAFDAADVDTRADIYALGVILYELLTGTTPLTREVVKKAQYDEMLRLIREAEAPTPSSRLSSSESAPAAAANRQTEPAKLGRFVRGDLDWIVLKALAKERDRRYETATGFARDVERFLNHEPVEAGPPSAAYRFKKFVRRNRGQVIAASLVLAALLAGVAGTGYGLFLARRSAEDERIAKEFALDQKANAVRAAGREADERKKAETKEAEATAMLTYFEDSIFAVGRPKGEAGGLGRDVLLRDAIRAALPILGTSFRDQPVVEARLRLSLGTTFQLLGDSAPAAEQNQLARANFQRLFGPDHPYTLKSSQNLANSFFRLNRLDDARKIFEETLAARKRLLGDDHPDTIGTTANLAACYSALNRDAESLSLYEPLADTAKRVLGPEHDTARKALAGLAIQYAKLGRETDALRIREEVLAVQKRVGGPDHPDTLRETGNLANSYAAANRFEESLKLNKELVAAMARVLGPDHPDTYLCKNNLASNFEDLNRHAEALKLREEVLAAQRRIHGPDHPHTLRSTVNVAGSCAQLRRHAEALPLLDSVLAKATLPGVERDLLRTAFSQRLDASLAVGDAAGCRRAVELFEKSNPTDAVGLYFLASGHAATAKLESAAKKTDAAARAKSDADRAMAWLTKAVEAGFQDAEFIAADANLEPLRNRDDFKKLLAKLEAKARPGAAPSAK